jgi:mono/diheme cytochrome c family protein
MGKIHLLGLTLLLELPFAYAQSGAAERGNYIVNNVAMCGDCHTPKLPNGQPDGARKLKGAEIDFGPLRSVPNWAKRAPDLTSGGQLWWSEQQLATFLETGRNPKGKFANPPMPPYRMRPQDAQAVVEYLKTLR